MKDIEKIKSEDLAAQVQDANPANFAIEQEVAQLVSATVPQPTQPSADDARELGAQLLVFLRRALLPIRSAMRTAVAAIYAHLDSRCTDYTPAAYASFRILPYDPMTTPRVPRTLPNILTALTAFSARKISNGSAPNDGIPDGTSLARLLCADYADVVELKDDNPVYGSVTFGDTQRLFTIFPNIETLQLNIRKITYTGAQNAFSSSKLKRLKLPYLEVFDGYGSPSGGQSAIVYGTQVEELDLSALKKINRIAENKSNPPQIANSCTNLKTVDLSGVTSFFTSMDSNYPGTYFPNCQNIEHIKIGRPSSFSSATITQYASGSPMLNLIDLEFGQGTNIDLHLEYWNPTDKGTTFLQNFREHIALRLTSNGSGKTLTLSQAVRDAIHAAEATYGIEAIIVTQKGWTLSPAPTA